MKYLVIFMFLLACTACNTVDKSEALNERNNEEKGLLQTGNDNTRTSDDLLVESREEFNLDNDRDPLHPTKAEELVREKLDLHENEDMIVQYDHLEKGNYIIHVYSVVGVQEKSEAWYMVDLETEDVEPLKR
ncbi:MULTISPECIES: hypothetical protein [Metabacillus]|jgi:hypothetical protein|uniref:PepSY domain-containing protein n=3 Tax=Metabacillus TaxID=2675233 RepID=A0A179SZV7_9BACI|nr:hypothetical protein [Metabacillus litoralis]OAS86650.1 hypothetical protein A6K24_03825 [Metabacillus litoralis]